MKKSQSNKLSFGYKLSKNGEDLIKRYEGLKLKSYLCPAGVWTIGYGTTRIKGKPVVAGMTITKEQADEYFRDDIEPTERFVNLVVTGKINQNQFDSIVSLVYNIGEGNFSISSVLKLVNQELYLAAADRFRLWCKARDPKTGKLKVLPGLVKRRAEESALFLK